MAGEEPLRKVAPTAKDPHQSRIADPVKAIASKAKLSLCPWQGIGDGDLRVRRMKGRVKGRDLRQIGGQRRKGLNPQQICRIVQGRQGHAGLDLTQDCGCHPAGRRQPRPAMHHAMTDAVQLAASGALH